MGTADVRSEMGTADVRSEMGTADVRSELGTAEAGPAEIVTALYRYLGRTPSKLLTLSLADAVGEMRTQNQPGTTDEYPNWRVPLGGPDGRRLVVENVFDDARANALCEAMAALVRPAM
jgi:4-alpha-glucanotransferase